MSKELVIRVRFDNGATFDVPARIVAENCAGYYFDCNADFTPSKKFLAEVERLLDMNTDSTELIDWAQGEMSWEDLESFAKEVYPPEEFDYDQGFVSADLEVIG
jgi:hypothetical protein